MLKVLKVNNLLHNKERKKKKPWEGHGWRFFFVVELYFSSFSVHISICHENLKLNLSNVHILI